MPPGPPAVSGLPRECCVFVSCFAEDRRSRCAPLSFGLFTLLSLILCGLNTPVAAQSGSVPVANFSFETPVISNYDEVENGYTMRQAGQNPVWTISDYAGIGLAEYFNKDASGHAQAAPDGNQVGYVQSWHGTGSSISQSVSGLQSGQSYYVIVAAAQSVGNTGGIALPVQVSLGAQSYTFTPTGTNYRDYTFGPFTGSAGSQTLRFATVTQSTSVDAVAILDNVRVVPASSVFAAAPGVPVPNFSFEAPTISSYYEVQDGYAMMQAGTNVGWTLSAYSGIGLAEYFNKDEPGRGQLAPDGSQVAYVQSYYSYAPGTISQTVSGFQPGQNYYLIVSAAQCGGNTGGLALPVVASLGGQTFMFTPNGTQYQDYTFGPVTAAAASQTVGFMAVPQSSSVAATAMLDNVRVVLSATPSTPAVLSLYPATVTGGSSSLGTVTLSSYAPPSGVVVTLSSSSAAATVPASVTVPGGQRSANFTVSTTSVASATTTTISATAGGATQTANLTVNSALRAVNLNNGDTLSGEFLLNVIGPANANYKDGDLTLQIDGNYAGTTGDTQSSTADGNVVSFSIATDEYANGNHTIFISDGINTVTYQVVFINDISNITYDDLFDSSGSMSGDGIGTSSTITATTSGSWTVNVQTTDGAATTIRSYSGMGNINVVWDGKDANGNEVDDDAYTVSLSSAQSQAATPPATHQKATNKQNLGDALLVFNGDKTIFPAGYNTCIDYKNSIVQKLKPYKTNGSIRKIVPIIISNVSLLKVPSPKYGNKIDPIITLINKELSTPLRLFYIDTHGGVHITSGGQQYPYFDLGSYGWYSTIDPSSQKFVGLINFDMGQLVAPANYGGDFGNNPPGIVWIDSCGSAGSDPNNPQLPAGDPNTGVDAFGFANDFQSGNYFGIFLGWSGYATPYGSYAPPMDDWTFWRLDMWSQLLNPSNNYQTAFNHTVRDYRTHGYHFPYNNTPEYRARITGNGSDNF